MDFLNTMGTIIGIGFMVIAVIAAIVLYIRSR